MCFKIEKIKQSSVKVIDMCRKTLNIVKIYFATLLYSAAHFTHVYLNLDTDTYVSTVVRARGQGHPGKRDLI